MNKKNNVYVESGRRGGKKGGKAKSAKKKRASRLNLKKANEGRVVALKIDKVEDEMVENREAWMECKTSDGRRDLDRKFKVMLKRKKTLEKQRP